MTPDEQFVDTISRALAKKNQIAAIVDLAAMSLALLRRVEKLEAREVPKYAGVWHSNGKYQPGAMVTDNGSLFYCKAETTDRPGKSDAWQLCCKRGKDGRDLR